MTNRTHIREEELELYALGALPEQEVAGLKLHVAACGECAMKLAQSRGEAALLSFAAREEQPAGTIKAELMARLRANEESEERHAWPYPALHETESQTEAKTNRWWNRVLVPAAVALALVSLGLSWQNRRVSQALERQRQATQALQREREQTERLIALLGAPDTLTYRMVAGAGTVGSGMVRYNARIGLLACSVQLPPAPAGKTYQLWLLPKTGAPLSAGVMEEGSRAMGSLWLVSVPANREAKAFAVTLEAEGGVAQPTGPKLLADVP